MSIRVHASEGHPARARVWIARELTDEVPRLRPGDELSYDPDASPNVGDLIIVTTDDGYGAAVRFTPERAPDVAGVVYKWRGYSPI